MNTRSRSWKILLPLAVGAIAALAVAATSLAAKSAGEIKVGIMTDCKGAFGGAYEEDIAGVLAAFSQYAGAKPKNPKKPSDGIVGGSIGGKTIKIVGYGCGDETPSLALK
jgi:hypothetical protein